MAPLPITGERLHACRTIVFDFDGTLCDSAGDIKKVFVESAVACGHDPATLSEIPVGPPLGDSIRIGVGRPIDEEAFETLVAKYRECYANCDFSLSPLFPGALELLQRLKDSGKRLAIATNKGEHGTNRILEIREIASLFDMVLCHNTNGEFWSKERMLHAILNETQTTKNDAIFFGDAPTDIAAGKNVGIETVAALYGYGNRDELLALEPDFLCTNIAELLDDFLRS